MSDEKWKKFSEYITLHIDKLTLNSRTNIYSTNYNTLNKNWDTLKNIIIEAADHVMLKMKLRKRKNIVKQSTLKSFKLAKSLNKLYRFIRQEKSKSLKWIK